MGIYVNWICFFGWRTKNVLDLISCTIMMHSLATISVPNGDKSPLLMPHAPLLCISLVGMILDPLFGASNYLEIGGYIPLEIYNCCVNIHKEILTAPSMCARMGCGALRSPGAHFAIRFLRGRRSCGWLRASLMPIGNTC